MTKKIKNILIGLVLMGALTFSLSAAAFADSTSSVSDPDTACNDTTTATTVNSKVTHTVDPSKVQSCLTQSPIVTDIQTIVDFLSAGVGVIVTAVIIVGGIQYSIAGDNPQAVTAAKKRITNGLIALVVFLFIFAFLQWIIPGGIFS